jgi:DNA repair protein RecO (recombination protein O)
MDMRDRIYNTQAIILRRSDFGEADRLLLLATPAGKRHVIAKGVRKTTSRIAGHIELFAHTTMMLAKGRNLDVVTQSQVLHHFTAMRADLSRLGCAYYVADLYDACTHEEENPHLFTLVVQTLSLLDKTDSPDLVLRAYELKLLQYTGYRPHLQRCVVCQHLLTEEAQHFSPELGGVLCPSHASHDRNAIVMSFNAFKLLRYLQQQPLQTVERIRISAAVRKELEQLLRAYLRHILERDLKSITFLESVCTETLSSTGETAPEPHTRKELYHGIY